MTTFLQTTSGDLSIDATTKRLVILTDPDQQAAQKLRNLFLSFLGEWQFDTRLGIPYYQMILGVKNPNLDIIKQLFRETILSVSWVATIVSLSLSLASRRLTFDFSCQTQSGAVISGGSGVPFIVTIPQTNTP